ncbi:Ectonucleotide pyrophosphatase/phosphodiesterase family member 3 [Linum grandiflorum]
MAKPRQFIQTPNQTTSLLSDETDNVDRKTHPGSNPLIFTALIALSCVGLAASSAFGYLYFTATTTSSSSKTQKISSHERTAHPSQSHKLPRPVVIMISSDGFRFGYQFKTPTPNIDRLIAEGTSAERGLIPVYPTLTFPNHYSMVTGLYPPYHGIINNYFVEPSTGDKFTVRSHDRKFWLGEPLWVTVTKHGLPAAAYYWAGSEVLKGDWICPRQFCPKYNRSVPLEERIDKVLRNFDLPKEEIPVLMNLYLEEPDAQGHQVGPDDPRITAAVAKVDAVLGRLINGLESRQLLDEVTIIFVGDHGMVGTCGKKYIYIEDLSGYITIPESWVMYHTPVLSIRPPAGVDVAEVVAKMNEGLKSGNVTNGGNLKVYLKEDLPERLHYSESDRIPPIIGIVAEGYMVAQRRTAGEEMCWGSHGYDNELFSMRTIFVGRGPRFGQGVTVPSFENVELYNMVTSILGVAGAPNNGSIRFANSVLLS